MAKTERVNGRGGEGVNGRKRRGGGGGGGCEGGAATVRLKP